MKHKLLAAFAIAFSFALGACSLGGNETASAKPWGNSSSAPIWGSSSNSPSSSSESKDFYTVTFYVDREIYETQTVKKGYQAQQPKDPYKSGYTFKRWEDKNGNRWNFTIDLVWGDTSLYAVFEEGEFSSEPYDYFTVNFYVEGTLYDSQQVLGGSLATRPSDPYLSGYTFLGWRTEYGDMWDFSQSVYSSMNLYAAFDETGRHHIITLYGDFTGWVLYNEYERKSGNGFPMEWEGIYLPASTAFGFHVLYDDGEEFIIGWGNLFTNGCPYVTFAEGGFYIQVTTDVTLGFTVDETHQIVITSWAKGASSSEYPSSESTYSSQDDRHHIITLYGDFTSWKQYYRYQRKSGNGFPMTWEDVYMPASTTFGFHVLYDDGEEFDIGWGELTTNGCPYVTVAAGNLHILTTSDVTLGFTVDETHQITITSWAEGSSSSEYSSSSESTYSSQSSSSVSSPTLTLTVNRDNWTKTDTYVRYESEGYPIVWEDIDFAVGDEFYITLTRPNSYAYSYGWVYLDDASASSGYFAKTGVGIQTMVAGTYSISFTQFSQIIVSGWEDSSSSEESSSYDSSSESYDPSSSESTYSSESSASSESALLDGWYLIGSFTGWGALSDYRATSSNDSTVAIWENVSLSEGDLFLLGYVTDLLIDWGNAKGWTSVGDKSTPYFADGGGEASNIVCMQSGIYNIYLTLDYSIYFATVDPSPSESTYSSESYTTEESVTSEDFAPGYYLVCNDNDFTMNYDDVGSESVIEGSVALWENRYFDEGDYFAIRHKFDDGHTFDLGHPDLLDTCEACDELDVIDPIYISFKQSGNYSILLTENESILVYHTDAESIYKTYAVALIIFNTNVETHTVVKGSALDADTFVNPPFYSSGYHFDHWEDGNGTIYTAQTPILEDVTLYAVYLQEFTVTLFYNYPAYSEYSTMTVVQNRSFTLPSLIAPVGLEFECWTYNNVDYPAGEYPSYDFGEGITFTAKYKDLYPLFEFDTSIQYVTGYNAEGYTSLVIPAGIRGFETLGIGSSVFEENQSLQEVVLPSTIKTICANAFSNCPNLTSITFDGTLEEWAGVVLGTCWADGCPVTQVICKDGVAVI